MSMRFTRPRFNTGYGAVLKKVDESGPFPTRASILKAIGKPTKPGYYAGTFTRLIQSGLLERRNGEYVVTKLGRKYLAENCK